jgi:hypothetical protein
MSVPRQHRHRRKGQPAGTALLLLVSALASRWNPSASGATTKTVYIFRHCVRSIDTSSLDAFSAQPFPAWGVPKDMCVPRGLDIMRGVGRHLLGGVGQGSAEAAAPTVVADSVQRNIDSAHALAAGLGLPAHAVVVDGSAFVRCPSPSGAEKTRLIAKRLKAAPAPSNASALVAAIDMLLGGKGEKRIAEQPDTVKDGKLKGRISLASMAAETFLMQWGAGLPVAWGKLGPSPAKRMHDLERMHVYEWSIDRRAKVVEQAKSSRMLAAIVSALGEGHRSGAAGGGSHSRAEDADSSSSSSESDDDDNSSSTSTGNSTVIFLGHDTDINGLGTLLDLGWHSPPFPDNTTAPNVALRFRMTSTDDAQGPAGSSGGGGGGGRVAVDFVYTLFNSTEGALLSTPLRVETVGGFCARARAAVDPKCAPIPSRAPSGLCSPPSPPPGPAPPPSPSPPTGMQWICLAGHDIDGSKLKLSEQDLKEKSGTTLASCEVACNGMKGCVVIRWHTEDQHCHVLIGPAPTHSAFQRAVKPSSKKTSSYDACLLLPK